MALPSKICATCGRSFAWRKKWASDWDQVRYCSKRCRRHKVDATDRALEKAILDLLDDRRRGATICPSEAARRVAPDDWRPLMDRTRSAARRLVADDRIAVTQKGQVVDPDHAKGPIRLRLED